MKCPSYKMSNIYEMSYQWNVLPMKCPSMNCLSMNNVRTSSQARFKKSPLYNVLLFSLAIFKSLSEDMLCNVQVYVVQCALCRFRAGRHHCSENNNNDVLFFKLFSRNYIIFMPSLCTTFRTFTSLRLLTYVYKLSPTFMNKHELVFQWRDNFSPLFNPLPTSTSLHHIHLWR